MESDIKGNRAVHRERDRNREWEEYGEEVGEGCRELQREGRR